MNKDNQSIARPVLGSPCNYPAAPKAHDGRDALRTINEILEDPAGSYWLKDALRSALNRDCLDAAYDAELLAKLLMDRAESIIAGRVLS